MQNSLPSILIRLLDRVLRRLGGVREFAHDPECVFRLSLGAAPNDISFRDGSVIKRGAPVGILHVWSEHMPPIPVSGPDLAWARQIAHAARKSLRLLAVSVSTSPQLRGLGAIGHQAIFLYTRPNARLLERLGFEEGENAPPEGRLARMTSNLRQLWAWELRKAFNPRSIQGLHPRDLLCRHAWLTRRVLMEKYGRDLG